MSTINPGDPRLPKKQRRRDEAPPDSVLPHTGVLPDDKLPPPELAASVMECDNNQLSSDRVYAANQSISYKEAVTGVNSSIDEDLIPLDDDDIELFEDDFRLGISDGIPTIDFSSRVQDIALKSMEFTLVLKVLGRRIGYSTLYNRLIGLWKPSQPIKLTDIENDHFLVKFASRTDYIVALTDGPWIIFGHYITVEPWSPDFDPSQDHPSRIMAWVRLPGLPITCCGTYGHANHNCPRDKLVESAMDSDLPQLINPPNQQPVESYGPWMLVERRRRRPALSRLPPNPVVENPRYNPIFLETDNDNLPPTADNTPSAPSSPHRSNSTPRQVPIVQDQVVLPASPPVIPGSVPTERVQDSDTRSHSSNARTKGKSPISLRKSALVVLGSRDMNIMIRKPTPGASSSRRSSKARSQPSNLNPTKHSAVVLSESAPPVTMLQLQQKQTDHSASPIDNSKSLTRTNSAPPLNNSVSVSQEPLGHLAMADC
ncbi:hypothetical protein V6N11_022896 [Hibiscus sabdariffa]|uniref:DUF4283 domain-containing protein n=1 Tax=Hibiscus sabdariffa TaxID=183260 RepID=A0ABR2TLF0_9ROSI